MITGHVYTDHQYQLSDQNWAYVKLDSYILVYINCFQLQIHKHNNVHFILELLYMHLQTLKIKRGDIFFFK